MDEARDKSPSVVEGTSGDGVDVRYVAYCDILGFSNKILSDFDRTLDVYRDFGKSMSESPFKDVQATMYSDAILVTGIALGKVLSAMQSLWFKALTHDLMIRGAITKGRYWQERRGNHLLVASEALVRAVKLEKSVGIPAVVIADDVEISDELWKRRFTLGSFETPVLHFRDRNIVNPFNTLWGKSASFRARELMNESPTHRDKYLWFLALYEAVAAGQELIPPAIQARLLREGILIRGTLGDRGG